MLGMDINQRFAQRFQYFQPYRGIVDKGPRCSVRKYVPSDDALCIMIQVFFTKECLQPTGTDVAKAFYDTLLIFIKQGLGISSVAHAQSYCPQHNGFTCSRFAGNHIETGGWL